MPTPSIKIVNGTHIVPLYFPAELQPDQIDKLGWTAIITLVWPTLFATIALLLKTRDWKRYSYTLLCLFWFWSVALVAVAVFTRYGVYDHFLHFFVIMHVQWEWLIISYLLGLSAFHGFVNASLVGFFFYITDLGFPGIRATFVPATILGGWGDVFMPLLLWNGGQRLLALGGVGHFLNALVTFVGFVDYIPVGPYLALQIVVGGAHTFFVALGLLRLEKPPIQLEGEEGVQQDIAKGKYDSQVIPTPSREEVIKFGVIAALLSLPVSLALNFAPKWPL